MRQVRDKPQEEKASRGFARFSRIVQEEAIPTKCAAIGADPRLTVSWSRIDTTPELAYSKLWDLRFLPDRRTSNPYAFFASPSAVFSGRPTLARSGKRGGNTGRRPGRARRRHDALAARLGHLHSPARRHAGDALGAAGEAFRAAQMDGLADRPRHHDAGPGHDAGLPRPALFGQRRHGRAYHRRREEDRGQRLGARHQRHAFARLLHLHVQVRAAARGHQAEEPLSCLRQPDRCSTSSTASSASHFSCCSSGASRGGPTFAVSTSITAPSTRRSSPSSRTIR